MKYFLIVLFSLLASCASAKIVEQSINYTHNGDNLKSYIYYDDTITTKIPAVLVAHEWWGLNDYAKYRAKELAKLGYVGFAIDMYGSDKKTKHGKQAKQWMQGITKNKDIWVARANFAYNLIKKHNKVNANKIAAIGYCFGGATVIQMAYSGIDLKAIISFHGSLIPATYEQANNIKASILINNGASDKFVSTESINKFQKSLDGSNVDWQFINYSDAKHGFTNKKADEYGQINAINNLAYNKLADKRSWLAMQNLLTEVFNK